MPDIKFGLPTVLDEGLTLRWATQNDVDALAEFNVRVLSDDPACPEEELGEWTRDLMGGRHPTTSAQEFTIVTDSAADDKIVSSLCLISQTWAYEGISFGCGRPELVGTDPAYRRRGLIRAQMEAVHAKSAARGERVQAISGIPWFYRKFGYEMALGLGGGRPFYWSKRGNDQPVDQEAYKLRPANANDIPALLALYPLGVADSLVKCVRNEEQWSYEMTVANRAAPYSRNTQVIESSQGGPVGYVDYRDWGNRFVVRELAVETGRSWRAVCLFLTRALKVQAAAINEGRDKPIDHIYFGLGESHPAYRALGRQLERQTPSFAWFVRVPDLPGFLHHIAKALEKRLDASVLAGYSGYLRLNFYHTGLTLSFENGLLGQIDSYSPAWVEDGDATFPDLTFLQLLFGYRSLAELEHARADCFTSNAEAAVLLEILFPRRPSHVVALG